MGGALREGAQPNPNQATHTPPPAFQPLIDPIHDYSRSQGTSVTGGYVYRGRALGAAYRGAILLRRLHQRRVWSIGLDTSGRTAKRRRSG